jgi:5-methylcytosine-specific restriction endonuclease McrA
MPKVRVPKSMRQAVIDRARGCCEYCVGQQAFSMDTFSVEHTWPSSKGGTNAFENLALSCQGCNNCKHTYTTAIDPKTNQIVPLYNPRKDEWQQHFAWSEDYTLILGLTPTGRATVELLQLNRLGNQNLRQVLYLTGYHPPKL